VILAHKIALDSMPEQVAHCRRACATSRYACNWGLAEWKRRYDAGETPSVAAVKRRWNAHRKAQLPWFYPVTRCASGQAVMDLGAAFAKFFRDHKKSSKQRKFRHPRFKKRQLNESFDRWVDQFDLDHDRVRIRKLGRVRMRENVRLCGVIMGTTVSFEGGRWFISVQVGTADERDPAPVGAVCGDLGVTTLATISSENGTAIEKGQGSKLRKRLLGRIRRQQRRISLQKHRAKKAGLKASRRQCVRQLRLSRLQARLAKIRQDALHKLAADLTKRLETVVIKNHAIAGSVLDCGLSKFRRQLQYKAPMRGGRIGVADRFLPLSKTCSACGCVNPDVALGVDVWTCIEGGIVHERDPNAAINLEKRGLAKPELTRGDVVPRHPGVSSAASAAAQPRTLTLRTYAHI
jgi:putative transposase